MIQPEQFNLFVIDQLTDQNVDGPLMLFFILCNRTLQALWVIRTTLSFYYHQNTTRIVVNFYCCALHSEIYIVHSPTNALFIKLGFGLKFTQISLHFRDICVNFSVNFKPFQG
jgi:hypothetical protein